ncbi:MAG TPA: FAD-dependent oxidoreductase [Candidatus Dormibacteraeota bacterium]|nr:FAD-dependent oxidoreductase [Candidatus Dormibacteraeota bacterium]
MKPSRTPATVLEAARDVPVVAETDVLVVGGGPAGVAAAVEARRQGARALLTERYPYLGGMASGGMVLVIDDMMDGDRQTVLGLAQEYVERLERIGAAVYPPIEDRYRPDRRLWNRWARWGCYDIYSRGRLKPITYSVAFDPDGWKRVSDDMVAESEVDLRLHSWFSEPVMEGERVAGGIFETPEGRQAIRAQTVVDASGDAAVAWRAGAEIEHGRYFMTLVHRYGGVDTERAMRFEEEHPKEAADLNREAKRLIGGSWEFWWLLTPLPGVVWCNCPHLRGLDTTSVEDLTRAEFDARSKIQATFEFARRNIPGFESAYLLDHAPQMGVRQGRLLKGEYIVTQEDVKEGHWFADSVARGRDYYTPYRSLIPRRVERLIVAGRCYSATPVAQRTSREIGPCVVMGQAAGLAAALALESGRELRDVDVGALQRRLREHGADPGDEPPVGAEVLMAAEAVS